MDKIRVLVANRPRLMREVVLAAISEQPDIEIIGELQYDSEILSAIERTRPDCVIVTLEQSEERPIICDSVFEKYPHTKILAVAPDQNRSICYWASLDIHANQVEASEEGVLKALRDKPQLVGGER